MNDMLKSTKLLYKPIKGGLLRLAGVMWNVLPVDVPFVCGQTQHVQPLCLYDENDVSPHSRTGVQRLLLCV